MAPRCDRPGRLLAVVLEPARALQALLEQQATATTQAVELLEPLRQSANHILKSLFERFGLLD